MLFVESFKRVISTTKNVNLTNKGPLDGVRILDLTRILAGPYCTMILGDCGAEVIKVEEPSRGDDTRAWGPPFAKALRPGDSDESAYFLAVNRNKKSIAIDLKQQEGLKIVKKLASLSDVLVENYIPGKLDKLGLGYEQLRKLNSRLIYASITGYGPDGPFCHRVGYDVIIEAEAGFMHITGEPDGEPVKVGVAITDLTTGLYAHGAILAALFAREKTGRGQKLDLSLLESQVASLANIGSNYLIGHQEATRQGTAHASIVPYQLFHSKNGKLVLGAGNDRQFQLLCGELQLEQVVTDSKFETNQKRVENRRELITILQQKLSTETTEHWLEKLHRKGIPAGPVNNIQSTFSHPQVKHRKMIEELNHPTVGRIKVAGIPTSYSDTPPSIRLPPPIHGQHSKEILAELLEYSTEKIEELQGKKVITCK